LEGVEPALAENGFYVYENPAAWPEVVYLPRSPEYPATFGEDVRTPDSSVVSTDGPPIFELTQYWPGHAEIEFEVNSDSLIQGDISLNEGYSRGWRAVSEETSYGVQDVDGHMLGMEGGGGTPRMAITRKIVFNYVMPGLKAGWTVTGVAALTWLVGAIFVSAFRRRKST